jgi:dihydropteroate synthase
VPNARVLTAEAGASLRQRLAETLPEETREAAFAAADAAVLVLEGPGAAGREAGTALREAGAFADVSPERLVASGSRRAFATACARLSGAPREVVAELLRALDADRTWPASLRLRDRTLDFRGGAKVMGILNVTPDSFYDRGAYHGLDRARARAEQLLAAGADLIDIGGRSYAAGGARPSERDESQRVVPVVMALLRDGVTVPLSVDTVSCGVAEAALAAGAHLINDCSGLADPQLATVAARYRAGLVVMHLKGELGVRAPDGYAYDDLIGEVITYLRERTDRALAAGIGCDSIVVDPGLEFGKETAADLELLRRFGDLRSLGYPLLLAASRKRFLGRVVGGPPEALLVASLAAAAAGVAAGARLVRTHDVAETVQLVKLLGAVSCERPALGYLVPMEDFTSKTPAVAGQADPQDKGTATSSASRSASPGEESRGGTAGRTHGLADGGDKVDDELARPAEDRSPLT